MKLHRRQILHPATGGRAWLGLVAAILAVGVIALVGIVKAAVHDDAVQRLIVQEFAPSLPTDGVGGAAVAVLIDGRILFFNFGWADVVQRRPITSDSLFNLGSIRKAFEATVLAQAFQKGELAFDDPVSNM
jgi:beta-lactamase class C